VRSPIISSDRTSSAKARDRSRSIFLASFIDPFLFQRISHSGLAWLRMLDDRFRFDVEEVIFAENAKPHFELKDAFQLPQSYIY
jgi:hypothetical protein